MISNYLFEIKCKEGQTIVIEAEDRTKAITVNNQHI